LWARNAGEPPHIFAAKDVLRTTIEHGAIPHQTRPNDPPPQQAGWWWAIISFAALRRDDDLAMQGGL
jgi:hypothetical protein